MPLHKLRRAGGGVSLKLVAGSADIETAASSSTYTFPMTATAGDLIILVERNTDTSPTYTGYTQCASTGILNIHAKIAAGGESSVPFVSGSFGRRMAVAFYTGVPSGATLSATAEQYVSSTGDPAALTIPVNGLGPSVAVAAYTLTSFLTMTGQSLTPNTDTTLVSSTWFEVRMGAQSPNSANATADMGDAGSTTNIIQAVGLYFT